MPVAVDWVVGIEARLGGVGGWRDGGGRRCGARE